MTKILLTGCMLWISSLALFGQLVDCRQSQFIEDEYNEVDVQTIKYGASENSFGLMNDLLADVYQPVGDTTSLRPMIILGFGGSFVFGTRADMAEFATDFAKRGYVVASIDYRLWPWFVLGFPDSVQYVGVINRAQQDMRGAVRYFRDQALNQGNPYRIHSDVIMAGGLSAGAVTAIYTAYMDEDDTIEPYVWDEIVGSGGVEGTSGTPGVSSEVFGVISLSGGMQDLSYLDNDLDIPIASMHGTDDETVPFNYGIAADVASLYGSGAIHAHADQIGLPNTIHVVPGGGHVDIYEDNLWPGEYTTFRAQGLNFLKDRFCENITSYNDLAVNESTLRVGPNPVTSGQNLQVEWVDHPIYAIQWIDVQGRTVAQQSGWNQPRIDISAPELQGTYILAIHSSKGIASRKVVLR